MRRVTMNERIRIARQLLALARVLSGATIHHYIDFNDDVEKINDACEKNGCTVKYKFTKHSMEATISNGCQIFAEEFKDIFFDDEPSIDYSAKKDGKGEGFADLDDAIDYVFGGKDS